MTPSLRTLLFRPRVLTLLAMWGLAGCAGLNTLESEVATYSQWPAARKPSSFIFERLPSQQIQVQRQIQLETAARAALEAAGFKLAEDAQHAEVTVQVGVRSGRADNSPYEDPFWWRGGLYGSRFGRQAYYPYYHGPSSTYFQLNHPRYEREVALLIRDRGTNKPLYETRALTEGNTPGSNFILEAMFKAAMADFPYDATSPRFVRVELPGKK